MKKILLFAFTLASFYSLYAQVEVDKKTLTPEQVKELINQIGLDSTRLLRNSGQSACNCIDSVSTADSKNNEKKRKGFAACIDKEVNAYQMSLKLLKSMVSGEKEYKIMVDMDKNSNEYKSHYFQIERWLMDSCKALKNGIATNEEAGAKSLTDNAEARTAYNKGNEFVRSEDYASGIPWFEKAVKADPEFAFAWDNLGICYRRTNQLEKAEKAYLASLKIDPSGKTPLLNLPVVYQLQQKDEEAIAAYKNILKYYPDDPEVYYGIALVYVNNKKDLEQGLDNMCKAYNIYVKLQLPYRSDAEKVINSIYNQMRKEGKEDVFNKILKDNNISPNKKQ